MPRRPEDVESIFLAALERDSAAECAAYLDVGCGENRELRARVEALLNAHHDAGSYLENPAAQFVSNEVRTESADNGDTTRAHEEPSLGFLKPCDKPDRIGKLGHYEILEFIGRGGMGIVLRGVDPKLNRVVAIKVLAPELASKPEACKRFLREGQAAAAINHDHVVTIYGIDESGRLPFIVMEYVSGQSLQQRIDQAGPLELKDILRIGKQMASALAAAHGEGLIHRDIKPANILLENGVGRVKVTDFGLARAVDDVSITRSGTVAGTPQYMSPEQARGDSVDHRSDLFSLGGVLYAVCSGGPPFQGDSTVALIRQVCEEHPQSLQKVNPAVPNWLAEIVGRLLEKDREARLQSASQVADLLRRHLLHLQQPDVSPQPPSVGRATRRSSAFRARSNRLAWVSAAATLLLIIGLGSAEYSGATSVTQTIIRLALGEGTLVIEVDDPSIEVVVAEEELVFKGAGQNEIRVRPGLHTILARKGGKTVYRDLVNVSRGGKRMVHVRLEQTPPRIVRRSILQDVVDWKFSGQPSPQGDRISYVDWNTGNLGLHELVTGTNRLLTGSQWPQQAFHSIFSPDGNQIVYQFLDDKSWELRIVGVDGSGQRRIFKPAESAGVRPTAWSPDGDHILATLHTGGTGGTGPNRTRQLALISLKDGTPRVLKTRQSVPLAPMSFSPDGTYIAYKPYAAERTERTARHLHSLPCWAA